MDIKPPQAARAERHYKEKKSSRDKKHSRERRHKDKDRARERNSRMDRQHGGRGRDTDGHHRDRDRIERDRHHKQQGRPPPLQPTSNTVDIRYEAHVAREREHYRQHVYTREPQPIRTKDHQHVERRLKESSPDKKTAEQALEDLRSRLLSKRNKQEAERRGEQQIEPSDMEYRTERAIYTTSNRPQQQTEHYEYKRSSKIESSRKEHRHQKHKNARDVVEVIDSPENYSDIVNDTTIAKHFHKEDKHKIVAEDPELVARRAKLLIADREMARRKELAREELEARREMRRERQETNPESPNRSPNVIKKRRTNSSDDEADDNDDHHIDRVEKRKRLKGADVVRVSDNSADDTASDDTDTNSNTDTDDGGDASDEGVLPASPLSIGDLSKSERRRRSTSKSKSHSLSKSRSPQSRSRSRSRSRSHSRRTRSRSKSHSRTPSRSPQLRKRSRSPTPDSDFEKTRPSDSRNLDNGAATTSVVADAIEIVEILSPDIVVEQLPSYYPGIQGCRSVEEFQCLNRIEEGTYGVVYRARDKRTEEIVALKRLKMEKEKEGFPITSLREINTLLKGQHPNIVTVREIVVGSNMDKIFIVMDYVEHDLKSLMETMKHRKQGFLPAEVKCLTQQLLRAVGHLHDNWILHRDLKTSNLLLSHKGILKVGAVAHQFYARWLQSIECVFFVCLSTGWGFWFGT